MDINNAFLKRSSKAQIIKLVNYIGNDPARFKQLMDTFLEGPYRVTQRASWALSCCIENNPSLILPHLRVIIKVLEKDDEHDAVKRNILRLLQFVDLPKKYYGVLIDQCFELINPRQPIAIRVFSITVLGNIAHHIPDLKKELQLVIEDQLPFASAGFLARAKRVLKELKK